MTSPTKEQKLKYCWHVFIVKYTTLTAQVAVIHMHHVQTRPKSLQTQ